MLYMTGDVTIIVLDSQNLEELKKGRPAVTPDDKVIVAWTPDAVWLMNEIIKCDGDAEAIGRAIKEAAKRPEKPMLQDLKERRITFGENADRANS